MHAAASRRLADGRAHFQHGPIDLVIEAWGAAGEAASAYAQAWARFQTVLPELVAELPLLRRAVTPDHPGVKGPVARRMLAACRAVSERVAGPATAVAEARPGSERGLTAMAAVAGAVADEVLASLVAGRQLAKAYVNDGGDIALHLAPGETIRAGLVGDVRHPALDGIAEIAAEMPVRGVATSGWQGRSFSLGIADAATVLGASAAEADAAATLVANAVDLDHPAVRRAPARSMDPDSDLGERLVTVHVGRLEPAAIAEALDRGEAEARRLLAAGRIHAAVLLLRGEARIVR